MIIEFNIRKVKAAVRSSFPVYNYTISEGKLHFIHNIQNLPLTELTENLTGLLTLTQLLAVNSSLRSCEMEIL